MHNPYVVLAAHVVDFVLCWHQTPLNIPIRHCSLAIAPVPHSEEKPPYLFAHTFAGVAAAS